MLLERLFGFSLYLETETLELWKTHNQCWGKVVFFPTHIINPPKHVHTGIVNSYILAVGFIIQENNYIHSTGKAGNTKVTSILLVRERFQNAKPPHLSY